MGKYVRTFRNASCESMKHSHGVRATTETADGASASIVNSPQKSVATSFRSGLSPSPSQSSRASPRTRKYISAARVPCRMRCSEGMKMRGCMRVAIAGRKPSSTEQFARKGTCPSSPPTMYDMTSVATHSGSCSRTCMLSAPDESCW